MHKLKPNFKHDCEACTFIATTYQGRDIVDIYRSCNEREGYLMRFSSTPEDYMVVHRAPDVYPRIDGGATVNMAYYLCKKTEKSVKKLVKEGKAQYGE